MHEEMKRAYRSEHTRPQSPFVPELSALCRCMLSLGNSCPVYTNVSLFRKGSNLNRENRTRTYPTLNAPNTTQLFIPRLLPLGNQPSKKESVPPHHTTVKRKKRTRGPHIPASKANHTIPSISPPVYNTARRYTSSARARYA